MKKVFASMLAIALAATMAVPAFADTTALTGTSATNKQEGDYTIGVDGTYVAGTAADTKVSVDIAWDSMSFTYDMGKGQYDAADHKTTYPNAAWSTNKAGITVTNHSNTDITAAFSFAPANGVTTTGTFYQKSGDDYTKAETDAAKKLMLDSAEGKKRNDGGADDASPKDTIYFGVSGAPITENKTLGTITVKIAKTTIVTDEADLKAALEAIKTTGGTITLKNDITLATGKYFEINGGTENSPIVLDLNGHTMTGLLVAGRDLTNNQVVTANVVIQNGTLECTSDSQNIEYAVVMSWGDVRIKDVTVNATNYIVAGATSGGKIEVVDSTLNGGIVSEGITCTCMSLGGEFIFSGTVTMAGVMGVADVAPNNAKVTLKANGTYTLSGATFEVTTDTDYTVSDCESAYWLYELT